MRAWLLPLLCLAGCCGWKKDAPTAPADTPPGRFEGLPGWLGVVGTGDGQVPEALPTLAASVHDESPTDSWDFAKAGDRFRLVDMTGETIGTFLGHQSIPIGCDQTATSMAAFSSDRPLTGEAVWVVPATGTSARPETITAGFVSSARRDYEIAGLDVALEQTGPLTGRLIVHGGDVRYVDETYEKGLMAGGSEDPIDLTDDNAIGPPYPVAAFRFDSGEVVIVFRRQSWEGYTLDAWQVQPRATNLGWVSVYLCAF